MNGVIITAKPEKKVMDDKKVIKEEATRLCAID